MPLPRKPVIENEYTSKFAQHWRHECPQYCDFKGYGVKTADHCCSLSNTTSSYSLHPPYITFFPPLGNIHLSLDYESPQNFLASPPEPKNTNHSCHMLSPTIRLHNCVFPLYSLFLCLFFCLLSTIVQPLAITFNKWYIRNWVLLPLQYRYHGWNVRSVSGEAWVAIPTKIYVKILQIISSGIDMFVPPFVSTKHVNVKLYPSHDRNLLSQKRSQWRLYRRFKTAELYDKYKRISDKCRPSTPPSLILRIIWSAMAKLEIFTNTSTRSWMVLVVLLL